MNLTRALSAALLSPAPPTGDINTLIIVAVILIAAFMIFILLKSGKKR